MIIKEKNFRFNYTKNTIVGFDNKENVKNLVIPEYLSGFTVAYIAGQTFSFSSMESLKLPNTLLNIGSMAFTGCDSLGSLKIPASVVLIDTDAFAGCRSLNSVKIEGDSLLSIASEAFSECSSLTAVNIPKSVNYVGVEAFYKCHNLVVTMEQKDPNDIALGFFAFDGVKEIRVPQESLAAYKKAEGWKEYADRIKPIEQKQEQVQERRRGRRM